jgi:uncharacterized protein
MPNRLQHEKSPYLLQHKDNPVDWYPWGEEAFEKARSENKPIFLSIGYATCHWCHVMERESFENEEVARLLNETFVNVKVDREERPDVDHIYMTVCQMMNGHGGWPLTIVMTPDQQPFFSATYLPRESAYGRAGMLEVVPRIRDIWRDQRERLVSGAEDIVNTLKRVAVQGSTGKPIDETVIYGAGAQLRERFDEVHGGFGGAPRFPTPHHLMFLLRYWRRIGDSRALHMVEHTLERMRRGGIFDHVGFGFHRYSTDGQWLLPHFEKMLYDQAMHVLAYTDAHQATGRPLFRQVAEEVCTYVLRDLRSPDGAFYSAEDADSEGEEGKFYVWTAEELRTVLGEEPGRIAIEAWNVEEEGNFDDESTRQRTGTNILHVREAPEAIAARLGLEPDVLAERLESARDTLLKHREGRVRPLLDDKVLTDWNGLMIAALSRAAQVFDEPRYADAARKAAGFVLDRLQRSDGRLVHRFRDGHAGIDGMLDDYAFLSYGLIELYRATFEVRWLQEALRLTDTMIEDFADEARGGFFMTAEGQDALILRPKEHTDAAMPCGNSIAMWNLFRLARLTGRSDLERAAHGVARSASEQVKQFPSAFTALMLSVDFALGPAYEVVIAGDPGAPDTVAMFDALREVYMPNKVVLFRPIEGGESVVRLAPFTEGMGALEGRTTAYVCRDHACSRPVNTAEGLIEGLGVSAETA